MAYTKTVCNFSYKLCVGKSVGLYHMIIDPQLAIPIPAGLAA